MRLQNQTSRQLGKKKYDKWVIVVPKEYIDKLGWKNGQYLTAEAQGQLLIIRPGQPKSQGGNNMVKHTYENFKEMVKKGLEGEEGLTWSELRKKQGFDQARPFNKWVRRLEKDIGLIRERKGTQMYWRLYSK